MRGTGGRTLGGVIQISLASKEGKVRFGKGRRNNKKRHKGRTRKREGVRWN